MQRGGNLISFCVTPHAFILLIISPLSDHSDPEGCQSAKCYANRGQLFGSSLQRKLKSSMLNADFLKSCGHSSPWSQAHLSNIQYKNTHKYLHIWLMMLLNYIICSKWAPTIVPNLRDLEIIRILIKTFLVYNIQFLFLCVHPLCVFRNKVKN